MGKVISPFVESDANSSDNINIRLEQANVEFSAQSGAIGSLQADLGTAKTSFAAHIADAVKHITPAERTAWGGKADAATYEATLTAAGWVAGVAPYAWQQSVSVTGMLATDNPVIGQLYLGTTAAAIEAEREAMGCITRMATATDSVTAFCLTDQPVVAVKIQMKVVR